VRGLASSGKVGRCRAVHLIVPAKRLIDARAKASRAKTEYAEAGGAGRGDQAATWHRAAGMLVFTIVNRARVRRAGPRTATSRATWCNEAAPASPSATGSYRGGRGYPNQARLWGLQ
jgi:hypothetical protein